MEYETCCLRRPTLVIYYIISIIKLIDRNLNNLNKKLLHSLNGKIDSKNHLRS